MVFQAAIQECLATYYNCRGYIPVVPDVPPTCDAYCLGVAGQGIDQLNVYLGTDTARLVRGKTCFYFHLNLRIFIIV